MQEVTAFELIQTVVAVAVLKTVVLAALQVKVKNVTRPANRLLTLMTLIRTKKKNGYKCEF